MEFEVFEELVELGFELAGALFLFGAAFGVEACALGGYFFGASFQADAFGGGVGELFVEAVEELADVGLLGGHLGAGGANDCGLHAEAFGDVETGGGSGDAESQFVRGSEGFLVEAYGGVEDAGVLGGVDLERGEVRGDAGPGVEVEEVFGDGDGEGCAFFGVGGGAEFVEQDEGVGVRVAADVVDVDDVGGEAGEISFDGLGVADVGEDGVEEGEGGLFGGDGEAGLCHEGEESGGFEGDSFSAGVGPGDDELAGFGFQGQGEGGGSGGFEFRGGPTHRLGQGRDEWGTGILCGCRGFLAHAEFEEGVAGGAELEGFAEGGEGAVEFGGEAGADEVGFDFGEDGGACRECGRLGGEGSGEGYEDAVDLGLLFVEEANEFVVLFDGF